MVDLLSEPVLRAILLERAIEAPVRFEERTPSTQALARELADSGAPEWAIVAAAHQTEGRGRLGRTWLDEPGGSLLVSIVLRPRADDVLGLIPLLAGAAAAEAAAALSGRDVTCRWPNDLDVDGRKVGGILAESWTSSAGVVVVLGIGVNLRGAPTAAVPRSAPLGDIDAATLLRGFLDRFIEPLRGGPSSSDVLSRFVPRCTTLGRRVVARSVEGEVIGTARGIGDDGSLVIEADGRLVHVTSGEVQRLIDG